MNSKNSKQRLIEVMQRVNPDFKGKKLNEWFGNENGFDTVRDSGSDDYANMDGEEISILIHDNPEMIDVLEPFLDKLDNNRIRYILRHRPELQDKLRPYQKFEGINEIYPPIFNSLDRNLKRDTPEYEKAVAQHYAHYGYASDGKTKLNGEKNDKFKVTNSLNIPTPHTGDKKELVSEDINIDIEVGDTIMMGKFKNSPTVVKSIGKDEHGMPIINGKKVVTFRMPTDKNKK
jgi:hypothetical protein